MAKQDLPTTITTKIHDIQEGIEEGLHRPLEYYRNWEYKNTTLLILSVIAFLYFAEADIVQSTIHRVGEMGYLGAFITGIFFVSTFTVVPALALLYHLANILNPYEVALLAGLGGVVGDYIIFRFLKDRIFFELQPVFMKFGGSYVRDMFRTPYFSWLTPIVGAALIASPVPDEVGIGILGLSRLKTWQFLALTLVLDIVGVLVIVLLAQNS